MNVSELTVCVLDRPRHADLVKEIRAAGARIKFISDGDVAGCIMACLPETGVDLYLGTGGAPECVIAACAMKCLGGTLQAKPWPRPDTDDAEKAKAKGLDLDSVLDLNDLAKGDNTFFACTGITDGELVRGVHYSNGYATTESLVMRSKTGTRQTHRRAAPDRQSAAVRLCGGDEQRAAGSRQQTERFARNVATSYCPPPAACCLLMRLKGATTWIWA